MDYMESEEMIDLDLNWEFLALIAMESSVTRFKDTFQKKSFGQTFLLQAHRFIARIILKKTQCQPCKRLSRPIPLSL